MRRAMPRVYIGPWETSKNAVGCDMDGAADEPVDGAPYLVVEDAPVAPNLTPIYSVAKTCTPVQGNLTCSGTNEFCFLCAYCSTADCEVDLRAHIQELASQGQEVCTIARAVQTIYNKTIRDTLVHTEEDGTVVERPEWSLQSIRTHLLLSGEYGSIFETYEQFLYKSIIVRQANEIVGADGRVDETKTKALLASLKSFSEYRVKVEGPPSKKFKKGINQTAS